MDDNGIVKKVDGVLDQWLKDNISWMRAQHRLKGFKFQTDNGEFNSEACKDLVASHWGKLITNCPYSPATTSIIERSWRTIKEMVTVMLLHCGMAEHFWEEMTLYAVDIYNRAPPAKPNGTGLRQSPFEKMHGEIPSLDDFRPFGCRGYALK